MDHPAAAPFIAPGLHATHRNEVDDRRRLQRLQLGAETLLQELLGVHHLLVRHGRRLRQIVHRRRAVVLHWRRRALNDVHNVQLVAPAHVAEPGRAAFLT